MADKKESLGMYFDEKVAASFAEREQNEKNFRVAEITDRVIMNEINRLKNPLYAAELGGGAHPDRYHRFFARLLKEPRGQIDWVDVSQIMLKLARQYLKSKEYKERKQVIKFVESGILEYLQKIPNEKLDLAIMKYTLDHVKDINKLFFLLSKKLKLNGVMLATITTLSPELKSISTNARFLYNGKEFPDWETRTLKEGDSFTIKFFKESGNPSAGYLEGAETTKYYHSAEKIKELAQKYNFNIFLGNWKNYLQGEKQEGETLDHDILVLKKK